MDLFSNNDSRCQNRIKNFHFKRLVGLQCSEFCKLCFISMSLGKTASRMKTSLKGKYFAEQYLCMQWAKSRPSMMHGYCVAFWSDTLIKDFCLSTSPFAWGSYTLAMHCSTSVRWWSSCVISFTNSLPWSFTYPEKQPCLHINSYKNWARVVTFLSTFGFALTIC